MINLKEYENINLQDRTEIANLIHLLNDEINKYDEKGSSNIYEYTREGPITRERIKIYTLLIGLLTRLYLTPGIWDLRAAQDITAILGGHI
jgi:hypothetical protein